METSEFNNEGKEPNIDANDGDRESDELQDVEEDDWTGISKQLHGAKLHLEGRRATVDSIVRDVRFRTMVSLCIFANAVQCVIDAEVMAQCEYYKKESSCKQAKLMDYLNYFYLGVYSIEIILKAYAYRALIFSNAWNVFDIFVVVTGVITELLSSLPSVGVLRLLRLARLAKALRLVQLPAELYVMFQGFFSALTAISFGTIVVFMALTFWAVIGVVLIAPISRRSGVQAIYTELDCKRCPEAWTSVWDAEVTLFGLLLLGDGFQDIVIPILNEQPLTFAYFAASVFTVVYGMTNLILAVIVDKASQVHVDENRRKAKDKHKQHVHALKKFVHAFHELDNNEDGILTCEELYKGYDDKPEIRDMMNLMSIRRQDLNMLFTVMDVHDTGRVSLQHFASELLKVKNENIHIVMAFIKHQVKDLHKDLKALINSSGSVQDALDVVRKFPSSLSLPESGMVKEQDVTNLDLANNLRGGEEMLRRGQSLIAQLPRHLPEDSPIKDLERGLEAQSKRIIETCDELEYQTRLLAQGQRSRNEIEAVLKQAQHLEQEGATLWNQGGRPMSNETSGREDPPRSSLNIGSRTQQLGVDDPLLLHPTNLQRCQHSVSLDPSSNSATNLYANKSNRIVHSGARSKTFDF